MDEYQKRKEALSRYLSGEKVSVIVRSLRKSRQWFYNWLERYDANKENPNWFVDYSKAPKSKPTKIGTITEEQLLDIRKQLQNRNYSQIGAIAIQYECRKQGLPILPVWTINRIISRHELNKPIPRSKSHKEYPVLFFHTHQMDLVGPRYLKGDGRFYSLNVIDTLSHSCYAKPIRVKSSEQILQALVEFWQRHGMPDALQLDNELAFRGSNRYPHSFGSVVRFALSQGVAPVFIPNKEPWRNGIIEKFNDTFNKHLLSSEIFTSFDHLTEATKVFVDYHNDNHRYSSQQHKMPNEANKDQLPPMRLKQSIDLKQKILLESGSVYFIRFIRSDLQLRLPTESFTVKPHLKYSYVVAEVNIDNQCLVVRQNTEIIQVFEYKTPVDW